MCGLVGVAGKIEKKEKEAFKFLLHLDIIRGPHSTGVASIKHDATWELVKKKGNAWDLYDSKDFNSLMVGVSYGLIGHNRYATKGKVNNINAHPFEFNDVVGAHNGTIRGQHRLPDHTRFEVDSENIYHSIQQEGLEDTLSKLDGAYALTYWDKRTEEMVLLRNNERTLYYTFSDDGKTLFWASEKWMLSVALSRNGIKYQEIEDVEPCHIYRFSFERTFAPKETITYTVDPFEEFIPAKKHKGFPLGGGQGIKPKGQSFLPGPRTYKVNPYDMVNKWVDFTVVGEDVNDYGQKYISAALLADPDLEIRVYFGHQTAEWNNMIALKQDTIFKGKILAYRRDGEFLTVQLTTIEEAEDVEEEGEEDYSDTFLGYNNKLLTTEQFEQRTKNGCAWCSDPVTVMDAKFVHWIDDNTFLCPDCMEIDEVKEFVKEA